MSSPSSKTAGASQPAGTTPPALELGENAVVIDQTGLIVAAEPICAALFHWEPAELVGQPLEVLLLSGADKIRQHLVPDQSFSDSENVSQHRLFALARRKDDSSFAVAVTLQRQAGPWWAVAFHNVNPPPVTQSEIRAVGVPNAALTSRRRRAQVAAPLALESIPDIFQRAPDEAAPQPQPPATAPAAAPEPPAPGAPPTQPAPANSDAHLRELEQRLSRRSAELQIAQAHLQKQEEQLQAANSATQQATTALEAEVAQRTQLEAQLAQVRQAGDELNSRLSAEQQTRAESEARLHELEQRLTQSAEELRCAQAQSQPPPAPAPAPGEGEPALQDQLLELESRLRTTVSSLARTTAELETERGERRRAEQRAATLAAQMQQLHEELKNHLASKQTDHQRFTELEQQLHEQGRQSDATVAKLQSALELEQSAHGRLEAELRHASRAQANRLRRQLQPPAESLHRDTCRLLQLPLPDDQKQLLQTMLEDILLLQTSLQESPEP